MSTWDEKAKRHAMPNAIECPEDLTKYFGFKNGARWQREALLADDVIERAARRIYRHQVPANLKCLTIQWEEAHEGQRDHFRSVAHSALTAALGIEGGE